MVAGEERRHNKWTTAAEESHVGEQPEIDATPLYYTSTIEDFCRGSAYQVIASSHGQVFEGG